jgi:poly(3-hydroxyalkanoate) synthetase
MDFYLLGAGLATIVVGRAVQQGMKGFFLHYRKEVEELYRREASENCVVVVRGGVDMFVWRYANEEINPVHLLTGGATGIFSIADLPWRNRLRLRWRAICHFLEHPCSERWWAIRFDVFVAMGS